MDMREAPWTAAARRRLGRPRRYFKAGFARNKNAHFMTIAN
jgi:hypothetical protein